MPHLYTHSIPSPEDFFVRKFSDDIKKTSMELRYEETMIESQLLSSPEPENEHRMQKFARIRDFLALCRGESLV